MYSIVLTITQLQSMIDDTPVVVGSEASASALQVYNDAKASGEKAGAETINVLAEAAQVDPNPEVQAWIQKVLEAQQAQQAMVTNQGKLADKIRFVAHKSQILAQLFRFTLILSQPLLARNTRLPQQSR